MTSQTLFDFDQVFTASVLSIITAHVQINTNNNVAGRIDAQVADASQENWASVGYASALVGDGEGGVFVSPITFVVPAGKRWRIHNTADPVNINETDVAYILTPIIG